MSLSLTVDLPPEPDDRAVVLDRDAIAWQRDEELWLRVGSTHYLGAVPDGLTAKPWGHLLVDRGPLTRLVTETELVDYLRLTEEQAVTTRMTFGEPSSSPEPEADADLPRHWREGDDEPHDVTTIRDGSSEVWANDALSPWWRCTSDFGLGALSWADLTKRGPLVEPTAPASEPATDDVAQQAAGRPRDLAGVAFLRSAGERPTFEGFFGEHSSPSPRPRAVRDEPQA